MICIQCREGSTIDCRAIYRRTRRNLSGRYSGPARGLGNTLLRSAHAPACLEVLSCTREIGTTCATGRTENVIHTPFAENEENARENKTASRKNARDLDAFARTAVKIISNDAKIPQSRNHREREKRTNDRPARIKKDTRDARALPFCPAAKTRRVS